MAELTRLTQILDLSGDPDNPGPEEMAEIVTSTHNIAVVGMSRNPAKAARRVPSYLAAKGYRIIPVNPFADRILGQTALDCVTDVTEPLDMVLIFRPSQPAEEVVRKAAARPERPVIWLQEGIFGGEATAEARAAGLTVIQDLCMYKVHRALADHAPRVLTGST